MATAIEECWSTAVVTSIVFTTDWSYTFFFQCTLNLKEFDKFNKLGFV